MPLGELIRNATLPPVAAIRHCRYLRSIFLRVYFASQAHFQLQYLDDLDPATIRAELRGPSGTIPVKFNLGENGGSASYLATETGPHELLIWCEGELIKECPRKVRVHPDISKVRFGGMNKQVPLGSTTDMVVRAQTQFSVFFVCVLSAY